MAPVTYIPSQTVDESAFTSNRASVWSPWKLFFHDAVILFQNLDYVFHVILPLRIPAHRHGVRYHLAPIVANEALLALSIAYEVCLLLISCIAVVVLPGCAIVAFFVFTTGIVVLLAAPGWASRTVQSRNARVLSNRFPHEKWIFMNGVAQSHMDLQFTVDNLSATFQRPFLGIHNRSLGFVWDIGECLIQRCFGYSSEDVRICYDELKIPLLDPSITKVIVVAHSQGGIILSLTIDRMFAELSPTTMSKLEIYTFGSAAAHFNNPLRFSSHVDQSLRLKDHLEDHPRRLGSHRREEREEQLPPLAKPGRGPSRAEAAITLQQNPQILEQPIISSPLTSPSLNPNPETNEKGMTAEATNMTQPVLPIESPITSEPFGTAVSNLGAERLAEATSSEQSSHTQRIPTIQAPMSANSPLRPSSPDRPIGKIAEAVVDIAKAASPSFVWKSSSEDGGSSVQRGQPSDVTQGGEPDRTRTKFGPPTNPKDGAYDGTHSGLTHQSPHDGEMSHVNEGKEHIIPVIEHYCNEFDMVPRWGVLNNVRHQPQHRYAGSVFIHRQVSGHLFNRHYLDTMFPMDRRAQHFLDQVVDVDIRTAKARVGALASSVTTSEEAEPETRAWLLYDSILELLSPSTFSGRLLAFLVYLRLSLTTASWLGGPSLGQTTNMMRDGIKLMTQDMSTTGLDHTRDTDSFEEKVRGLAGKVDRVEAAASIQEGSGKTVRELSKLWKYMYGGLA